MLVKYRTSCLYLQRAVSHIDPLTVKEPPKGAAQIFKDGHKGILSTEFDAEADNLTTVRQVYTEPKYPGVATKGIRHKLKEQMYAEQAV